MEACPVCIDFNIAAQTCCPACKAQFTFLWKGGRTGLYSFVGTNVFLLIVVAFIWLFRELMHGGILTQILLPIISIFLVYRVTMGMLDLYSHPRTFRGRITDISKGRLVDVLLGQDRRLKIEQYRFHLEDIAIRNLRTNDQLLLQYTTGTKTIVDLYQVTENQDPQSTSTILPDRTHPRRGHR